MGEPYCININAIFTVDSFPQRIGDSPRTVLPTAAIAMAGNPGACETAPRCAASKLGAGEAPRGLLLGRFFFNGDFMGVKQIVAD